MMRAVPFVLLLASVLHAGGDSTYAVFDSAARSWRIGNPLIEARFALDDSGRFRWNALLDKASGAAWNAPAGYLSTPVSLTFDGIVLDEASQYDLLDQAVAPIDRNGLRQTLLLGSRAAPAQIRFEVEVYEGQPFLRYRTFYKNTGPTPTLVTAADMLPWKFASGGRKFQAFFVGQWNRGGARGNFEPYEIDLSALDGPVEAFTGAYGDHCTWGALRDASGAGILAGWEYNGRARAHAEHRRDVGLVQFDALVMQLNHPVEPGGEFAVPGAFLGLFTGDWDEAGYRTQRFVEQTLAAPMPEPDRFPYVVFDTWGYDVFLTDELMMWAAEKASETGAEVFTIDLGWSERIGDWRPNPDRFPRGLKPVADYVHSLGMKFGLHFVPLDAADDSDVVRAHPDWQATNPKRQRTYYGTQALCPSHRPVQEWIIAEAIRVIRENNVDWVLQDGENMVKSCDSTSHTHAPGDSNYSNAMALHDILQAVQAATPGVVWENCEDGGGMQSFEMVKDYVTSIVNDNSGFLTTRQGIYGATFPFSPRYTDRYMQEPPLDTYRTRSHMFGGPLVIMDRITEWTPEMMERMKREVAVYKSIRALIRDGKVYHLTPRPDGSFHDAIQSHDEATDRSVIFVYRQETDSDLEVVHPRGLRRDRLYQVHFQDDSRAYTATGEEITVSGIKVALPQQFSAEIVYLEPAG